MKIKNKKCHNCKNGLVDGGFKKRQIKELLDLKNNKLTELSNLKEKNKEKLILFKKEINKKYDILINKKENECPTLISKCFICNGKGKR